jgi:hypothetical protein
MLTKDGPDGIGINFSLWFVGQKIILYFPGLKLLCDLFLFALMINGLEY